MVIPVLPMFTLPAPPRPPVKAPVTTSPPVSAAVPAPSVAPPAIEPAVPVNPYRLLPTLAGVRPSPPVTPAITEGARNFTASLDKMLPTPLTSPLKKSSLDGSTSPYCNIPEASLAKKPYLFSPTLPKAPEVISFPVVESTSL